MAVIEVKREEAPYSSEPKSWPFPFHYLPFPASRRNIIVVLAVLSTLLLGVIAIGLFLIFRPSKPVFTIVSANIDQLVITNAAPPFTATAAITSTMQFSVLARNPKGRSDIAFNRLVAYVEYQNQPITLPSNMPPFELTHGGASSLEVVFGSAMAAVPVTPEVVKGLEMDKVNGVMELELVVMGMMKYKTAPFGGGWVRTQVQCDVLINLRSSPAAMVGVPRCSVES